MKRYGNDPMKIDYCPDCGAVADECEKVSVCCGCPEWVRMCAHFEERRLALVDEMAAAKTHDCFLGNYLGGRFGVSLGGDALVDCSECDNQVFAITTVSYLSSDLPAAEAEFHRREQELLRSES